MTKTPAIDDQSLLRWSTSIPNATFSHEIACAVRGQIQEELEAALLSCSRKFGSELSDARDTVAGLPLSEKWSPEVFILRDKLTIAMKGGRLTEVLDSVMRLSTAAKDGLRRDRGIGVSSILLESWEHEYVAHLRAYDQKNIRGETTIVRPIIDKAAVHAHERHVHQALKMIAEHDENLYAEILELVTDIKLFQGRVLRGDTSPRSFGAMWLRIPEPEDDQVGYWIEHIAHEVSHLRLAAVGFFDRVVLNPQTERKFRAPIRDDPRPMLGIFHASFVLARMVRVFHRLSLAGFDKRFRDRLQLCRLQFERGMETLAHPDARFTSCGEAIRGTLIACAEG